MLRMISAGHRGWAPCHFWWSRPSRLILYALVPIYLYCAYMDESFYAFYAHRAKYLAGNSFVIGLIALLACALGAALMERVSQPPAAGWVSPARVRAALVVLYALVLTAYAVFFFPLLLRPQIVLEHLRGSPDTMAELRHLLNRIPGFTSFVALQSLCVVLSLSHERLTGERVPRMHMILMIVVVVACVLRAWLWSERLALMELIVPAAVTKYALVSGQRDSVRRRLLSLAPLAGIVLIFSVFAFGEYFRSWQYYKDYVPYSFLEFSWARFLGYYATALANGALIYALHEPDYTPLMTAIWFYKLPLWTWFAVPMSTGYDYQEFLEAYLNPEFNTLSGVFMPLRDFGAAGGIVCWLLLGGLSGALFRSFAGGQILGITFYPVWFVGIAETLRIFYWGESRFSPVIIFALLLAFYLGADTRAMRRKMLAVAAACGLLALLPWGLIKPANASETHATAECELSPEQAGQPTVDVRAFGARGDGTFDDGPAIQAALDSLRPGGVATLAPGVYLHSNVIRLRHQGITLTGREAVVLASNPNRAAILLESDATTVRDLMIRSVPQERRGDRMEHAGLVLRAARSSAVGNTVEGFIGAGIFVSGAGGFVVACNRVSHTKADGIHVTEGAFGGRIAHNIVFNSEDDGIGLVSYNARRQVSQVVVEGNRIEHISWGRGISVVGSTSIVIRGNSVRTVAAAAGILVAREAAWHTPGAGDVLIEGNEIHDIQRTLPTLHNLPRTGHGAIELNSDSSDYGLSVSKVRVVGNTIRGAARDGVRLMGNVCDAAIENNDIGDVAGRPIVLNRSTCAMPISSCQGNRREGRSAECERL